MRAIAVSIWVFINLVFFGMCGYMYLLWSQYWMYIEKQTLTTTSTYDQQIYYYNRGLIKNDTLIMKHHNDSNNEIKSRIKHKIKENLFTLITNSRPRFPNYESDFLFDTNKFLCNNINDNDDECKIKTRNFKEKLLGELKRVLNDESNILKEGNENNYHVNFNDKRENYENKSQKQLMCELKKIKLKLIRNADVENSILKNHLSKANLFNNKYFNNCAVIASSGALLDSNLGKIIDSHDLILRFNHAPTKDFERDVGEKTMMRVLNSQIVSKEQYHFIESDLYKNITILIWDPSHYSTSLDDWLERPEFNFFPNYLKYKKENIKANIFILNPKFLWKLWEFLQKNSLNRLRRNPPSSGFLGLSVLLPRCNFVNLFEYMPSVRVTKKCHYFDREDNPACTFGIWHPLAAEKLITYHLNIADDNTVFQKGYIRLIGFKNLNC